MKFFKAACLIAAMALVQAATSPASAQESAYTLNPGDILRISVWREEELDREARVQPDGTVSFPLVGQIDAAGQTTGEVADTITDAIARYIPDAVVSVELLEALGNVVYVIGEVNRPGAYQISGATTVVQAISLAGGFTPFASTDDIRIVRNENGAETTFEVDYDDIESGRALETNQQLRAGDTVMVSGGSLF